MSHTFPEMLVATSIFRIKTGPKFRELPGSRQKAWEINSSAETKTLMTKIIRNLGWGSAVLGLALSSVVLPLFAAAQDQYQGDQHEDPPSRVARLGYMEGSVSFQPAGETDWVQAVPNRPMTTGDKLWADQNSRAELQLGSAVIRLSANTGFSFLNLDDRTVQIQLTSGALNVRVRRLDHNDVFEVDTPNLAFSIYQPGSYRVEASEDGTYSVVSLREGGGEATGNGQTYTLHAGQRGTFSGTDSLNAEVVEIGGPDQFDNWAYNRDHRYDDSRSARYLSHDVVGYEDLDDYGDWRDDSGYGHVWFPNRVDAGWAPYHEGHWDWIPPWGYTWVDDSPWGYAPFHYGRWVTVGGRWGWVAGPVAVRAVYAPALVVFIGGGVGVGFGGNVGWFPLGPREVYVPSYPVSREYVNRVNISNTTVNNTTITNVYNTTIINKTTNITNVTYVNQNVQGAVTAVPQRAFAGAQPVARAAVAVNAQQIASAPVSARVAVAPTRESVLGAKFATANRVTAPPAAVMNRQVIAKTTPPPPPVPFAKQQQALAAHPGQPLARQEVQSLRPAAAATAHPMVRQAPPGKPATPTAGHPGNQPGNQPNSARPGQPASTPSANQPASRPPNQQLPNDRPGATNPGPPNRPPTAQPNQPQPNNRPIEPNRPPQPPVRNDHPPSAQPNRPTPPPPNNRPAEPNHPPAAQPNQPPPQPNSRPAEPNRPPQPPVRSDHPPSAQPNNRSESNRPPATEPNRPPSPPANNRPNPPNNQPAARPPANRPVEPPPRNDRPPAAQPTNRPEPSRPEPNRNPPPAPARPATPPPSERPQPRTPPPAETRPAPPPQRPQPMTPEQRKQEEERKKQEKPPLV
jgi:hypothetical protein